MDRQSNTVRIGLLAATLLLFTGVLGSFAPQVRAQEQQPAKAAPEVKPSPGPAGEMLEMWERIAKMNVDMAEQFPEEKYGYKPTPEVRSFKEQMLHVASGNYFFIRLCGGEKTRASHQGRETKADVVAVLKESYADGAALIRMLGDEGLTRTAKHPFADHAVSFRTLLTVAANHGGEHFGQLVVYYRLNGLVPPTTEAQQRQ
jgi:uncharacterized damage-inducible protein DinB